MASRLDAFAVTLSEFVRRKPSGIPSATGCAACGASVSSSFPACLTLDGSPTALGNPALALPLHLADVASTCSGPSLRVIRDAGSGRKK